jgi:hypothetical protein
MPNSLRELHDFIRTHADKQDLPRGTALYAIGLVLFDFFENVEHREANDGCVVQIGEIDQYAKAIAEPKILRNLDQAHQAFGADALDFMRPEIERQIQIGIEDSILVRIRNYTSGWKTFGMNILAGIVSGALFAAISFGLYVYVKTDPSLNAVAKETAQHAQAQQVSPPSN